ncbi:ATP-binding protein [Actinoallomurus sp. NPDC052274]|uniref:ATP-binding protein n=1 Tax=Actinoallomurus sp. NPDC052274 TaxID=3155420 RepID=UPI003418DBAF
MPVSILCAEIPPDALRWWRVFPGRPCEAAAVRRFVAALLDDHPLLDEVLLAADELVVNAVRHTRSNLPGGCLTVEVCHWFGGVAVAVSDQGGPCEPVARDAGDLAESGRGLRTVSALANGWGWYGNAEGRTVIAVFTADDAPGLHGVIAGAA